ncbi:MAG: aminotransferase class IV family protein [Candidatus Omnitrophica bacterium]|nr:aminotransferase class IV family protein [Candidatus Omnitrophota bacterium]
MQAGLPAVAAGLPAVFETMIFRNRCIGFKDMYLKRFRESFLTLNPHAVFDPADMFNWAEDEVKKFASENGVIRISLAAVTCDENIGIIHMREFGGMDAAFYSAGVRTSTANYLTAGTRSSFHQIKSNNYLTPILSSSGGFSGNGDEFDRVFVNQSGCLTEGSVSNVFMVKNGVIWTPHPSCGILLGITRGLVLHQAQENGFKIKESGITRHEFYNADEAFLTNTTCGVIPVVMCDRRVIGTGKPGRITGLICAKILNEYKKIGINSRREHGG